MSSADPDIPKFALYGENTFAFDESIQPALDLRSWSDVPKEERTTALQQILNTRWTTREEEIVGAIYHLNNTYLRLCPGRNLHSTPPAMDPYSHGSSRARREAAAKDFIRIFLEEAEPLVLRMLSKFAQPLIHQYSLDRAKKEVDSAKRAKYVSDAFRTFDLFANCINHIFEQFAVNQVMTRDGFVPRQDETERAPAIRTV